MASHSEGSAREIQPVTGPIDAIVTAPGSKSITNRALLTAALADGESILTGALFSDDTHYMSQALAAAGVGIEADANRCEFRIRGKGGPPGPAASPVFLGNSGTSMRFLTSYFALGEGPYLLDGAPRMRERPIQDLIDTLRSLGADLETQTSSGCPPVLVRGGGIRGGNASIDGRISSQFVTSVLLSAPYSDRGVELSIRGTLSHKPYLDLTADVMEAFGVQLRNEEYRRFAVQPARYTGRRYAIEPDVSTASYFLAMAAITGGRVTVRDLTLNSRQGDIEFARLLQKMGCLVEDTPAGLTVTGAGALRGLDVDMNACSDVALTLAALAPFCESPTHIRNIAHARLQETDRIHAIVTELRRAEVAVEERQDGFSVFPSTPHAATFETYDDHRIAMSLSLIGLRIPGCVILNPECVAKTVPNYFELLDEVTGVKPGSASSHAAG